MTMFHAKDDMTYCFWKLVAYLHASQAQRNDFTFQQETDDFSIIVLHVSRQRSFFHFSELVFGENNKWILAMNLSVRLSALQIILNRKIERAKCSHWKKHMTNVPQILKHPCMWECHHVFLTSFWISQFIWHYFGLAKRQKAQAFRTSEADPGLVV